ncbi:unnamed protein product, partial [Rotaria sp. Silwood1]
EIQKYVSGQFQIAILSFFY